MKAKIKISKLPQSTGSILYEENDFEPESGEESDPVDESRRDQDFS